MTIQPLDQDDPRRPSIVAVRDYLNELLDDVAPADYKTMSRSVLGDAVFALVDFVRRAEDVVNLCQPDYGNDDVRFRQAVARLDELVSSYRTAEAKTKPSNP